jgi:hypothetical protein
MKLERNKKRTIISIIYIILFFLLGWGLYNIFKPVPTCFDGKKNQNELNVDCGGVCGECKRELVAKDLEIQETAFVLGGENKYDVVARISNPNISLGSSNFEYEFSLKDASGNVLATRTGKDFILPKENKYVIEANLETTAVPASVSFAVKNYQWSEFSGFEEPRLVIYQLAFSPQSGNFGSSEAGGLLVNESAFDFNAIRVNVVLRDESGKIVGLNFTQMQTVNANDQRDFKVIWPLGIAGNPTVEAEPEANAFDSQNFIRRYVK